MNDSNWMSKYFRSYLEIIPILIDSQSINGQQDQSLLAEHHGGRNRRLFLLGTQPGHAIPVVRARKGREHGRQQHHWSQAPQEAATTPVMPQMEVAVGASAEQEAIDEASLDPKPDATVPRLSRNFERMVLVDWSKSIVSIVSESIVW